MGSAGFQRASFRILRKDSKHPEAAARPNQIAYLTNHDNTKLGGGPCPIGLLIRSLGNGSKKDKESGKYESGFISHEAKYIQ
jgi:hypothetical protein